MFLLHEVGRALTEVGKEEVCEGRHIALLLPQTGEQQRLKELQKGEAQAGLLGVELQHLREDLEDVGRELHHLHLQDGLEGGRGSSQRLMCTWWRPWSTWSSRKPLQLDVWSMSST